MLASEHGDHGAPAAARRARPGGERRPASAATWRRVPRRRRAAVTVLRPGRGRRGGPDRLRVPGLVAGPVGRAGAAGVGVRDGAGLLPAHVRAPGADAWTQRRGSPRTWPRSSSSAACPARLVPDNLRTGVTGPTCTTRSSTGPTPRWPRTTAAWSTRPGRASRRTSRGSSGRCPTCGTASGGAGSGCARREMQARRGRVVRRRGRRPPPPAPGRRRAAGGVRRGRRPGAVGRCRSEPFELARWSTPKVGAGLPRQGRQGALLGAVAAHRPPGRRPGERAVGRGVRRRPSWSRPCAGSSGAGRPTTADYPPEKVAFFMRTPTWCRTAPASSARTSPSWSTALLADNAVAPPARRPRRDRLGRQARRPSASTPPAPGRSRWATRPTGR